MIDSNPLVVGGLFACFGALLAMDARSSYDRYRTLTDVASAREGADDADSGTAVQGPVHVAEPAKPERTPPEEYLEDGDLEAGDPPALWAWRVRRKRKRGGSSGGSRWTTVEGGLAVGEFAVERGWDRVRVDAASLATGRREDDRVDDPIEHAQLYLGEPEVDVALGEQDPVSKRLEKWGLTGEDGLLSDWEVTISVGRKTMTPDRYQAAVIRDGEDLLVRGELAETDEGPVLRDAEETPLVIARGDLEAQADRLRASARKRGAIGIAALLVGAAVVAAGVV